MPGQKHFVRDQGLLIQKQENFTSRSRIFLPHNAKYEESAPVKINLSLCDL